MKVVHAKGGNKRPTLWLGELSLLDGSLESAVELRVKGRLGGDGDGVVVLDVLLQRLTAGVMLASPSPNINTEQTTYLLPLRSLSCVTRRKEQVRSSFQCMHGVYLIVIFLAVVVVGDVIVVTRTANKTSATPAAERRPRFNRN